MAKFYKNDQDQIIVIPNNVDVTIADFEELTPNSTDGAGEKHVPSVKVNGNNVKVEVGEVLHPMLDAHWINDIFLETDKGFYRKSLKPGDEPIVEFILEDGEVPENAYEFCNLHGLWVKEI